MTKVVKIGVTASKLGISADQVEVVSMVTRACMASILVSGELELHHGDCIGGDQAINDYFMVTYHDRVTRVAHPAKDVDPQYRAHCDVHKAWAAKPPLARNRDIVDLSSIVLACPRTHTEVVRSGTWATVRYAIKQLTPMVVIYPNGKYKMMSIDDEWFDVLRRSEL